MEELPPLGKALRGRRREWGLSLRDTALLVGCSTAYLSHVETGRKQPSQKLLEQCAQVLAFPLEELVRLSGWGGLTRLVERARRDEQWALALDRLAESGVQPEELEHWLDQRGADS